MEAKFTPSIRWIQDGTDYIMHLGTMKKAIVVALYKKRGTADKGGYGISPRSYFPFTNDQMDKRFDSHAYALQYAEQLFLEWVSSVAMPYQTKFANVVENNFQPIED